MFTTTGTLRYSPKRDESSQHWWLILDCDPEIGRYYRSMYQRQHNFCRKLQRPFWGPHITVVRNEEPDDKHKHLWDLHAGEKIVFQYAGGVNNNYSDDRYRSFYWLEVTCPRMLEIRKELGLSAPTCGFHLTIGSWENPARRDWYLERFKGSSRKDKLDAWTP